MDTLRLSPLLLLLFFASLAPAASAQTEVLYAYELQMTNVPDVQSAGSPVQMGFVFRDRSWDEGSGVAPGLPAVGVNGHSIKWSVELVGNDTSGWLISAPVYPTTTLAGGEYHGTFSGILSPTLRANHVVVRLTATVTAANTAVERNVTVQFILRSTGLPGFALNPTSTASIGPDGVGRSTFEITNLQTIPRTFEFLVKGNECNLAVATPGALTLRAKETQQIALSMRGPAETVVLQKRCSILLQATPKDNPGAAQSVPLAANVTPGLFVDPPVVFNTFLLLLLLVLLILFLKRRKEKLEEEILGKPQKPWTIPVEKVYLAHLKSKDERAWYVVRHFLMEEEYRSSLLWYKSYKKATKGSRKKERLVLKQEKAYQRWKAAWAKDIAKPVKKADKFDAKLQRKLDRKARRTVSKEVARWKKLVAKLEAAAAKEHARALAKHEKAARKAEKKGLPVPAAPAEPKPDLPAEPQPTPILLADHRWSKKAARFRRRMGKRQGNLEVKFERADERKLRKLERKVRKIARKLDDPEFIEAHPILAKSAKA